MTGRSGRHRLQPPRTSWAVCPWCGSWRPRAY